MLDWNNQPIAVKPKSSNPCVGLYGPGPEAQPCKDCIHLRYPIHANPNARHWKCDLRKLTHGPATDHKVNWPSCAKYVARTEEYHGGQCAILSIAPPQREQTARNASGTWE